MSDKMLTGPELFEDGQEWLKRAAGDYRRGGSDESAITAATIAQACFSGTYAAAMAAMLVTGLDEVDEETEADGAALVDAVMAWRQVVGIPATETPASA
jgi:hypothetical protein